MFSRIKKEGDYVFGPGIRSKYDYDYASISDAMNEAYCSLLLRKLETWQEQHGRFDAVVGIETEGMRIGHILSKMMKANEGTPGFPQNTLIDWGGSLNLYEKYGIKDKKLPALFIIGREGKIMYAFQGWYNEDNLNILEKEVYNILK